VRMQERHYRSWREALSVQTGLQRAEYSTRYILFA
jgi:hypothetical protein